MLKVNCQNWSRRKAKIIIQVQKVLRHIKANARRTNHLANKPYGIDEYKKAYEDNVKSVNKNVTALKAQKTELDKQISLRSNEKRLLTEANRGLDKNSVAYKDNQKALNWVNTEIEAYTKQSQSISDSIRTQEAALSGSKKAYTDAQATVKKQQSNTRNMRKA